MTLGLLALSAFYAFSSLHARVRLWNDFAFVFAAGRTWLKGASPYDFGRWSAEWAAIRPPETVVSQPMPYMYPPHWAPLAVVLALLPWPLASRLWDAVSVVSYGATVAFSVTLLRMPGQDALKRYGLWAYVAFSALNPALRYAIGQSQMSTFATLGIAGAFWACSVKRVAWLALFTFIAALKPQLALLPLAFLVLNGGHRGVTLGIAAAAALGLLAMLPSGIGSFPEQYGRDYALHMQLDFNDPKNFSNLPALFPWRNIPHAFMPLSTVLAGGAAIALSIARRRDARRATPALDSPLWPLALVAAITGALMPLHAYDLVIYTPVVILAYTLRTSWLSPVLVSLVLLAGRPGFVTRHFHVAQPAPYLSTGLLLTLVIAAVGRSQRQVVDESLARAAAS